jgi:hypothetical protein
MPSSKRPPLSFPELEHRGRGAILRSAEEVQAEQEMLENQQAGMPASQQPEAGEIQEGRVKATYRISNEAAEAIEETKRLLRRKYQIKVPVERIAQEAILAAYEDLVKNEGDSMLVNKFARMLESQKAGK